MALIRSGTAGRGVPLLYYELYADQTSGSGTNRTVNITIKVKVNGSSSSAYYGFPVNWRANVNGTWGGWLTMKGTESWNATNSLRSFSQSLNVNVGTTSSKSITVGFQSDSYSGDNDWDDTITGSFTVGSTNTPPTAPSNLVLKNGNSSGGVLAAVFPENVSTIHCSWSKSSDNEGGTLYYNLQRKINDGGWVSIDASSTDLDHADSIGTGNEGASYQYWVDCRDSEGVHSSGIYSATITKNKLIESKISSFSGEIKFETNEFTVYFSKASNTDSSGFSCQVYSDSLKIYNPRDITGTQEVIKIHKGGAAPNSPYILFSDLRNLVAPNGSFEGRLHIGVRTNNNYGTVKYSGGSIGVNLTVKPVAPNKVSITGGTAKKLINGKYFYLPMGEDTIDISWEASSNAVDAPFTYEISHAYNKVITKVTTLPSSTTSYRFKPIRETNSRSTISFIVKAITSYGAENWSESETINLEFYNPPNITTGEIKRKDKTAVFDVIIETNTSIETITGFGSWTSTSGETGRLGSASQLQLSRLMPDNSYTVEITYNDDSKLSSNSSKTVQIGRNLPIVDINQFGLGVGGAFADKNFSLNAKGSINANGFYLNGVPFTGGSGESKNSLEFIDTIISNQDWNSITKPGIYTVKSATGANRPSSSATTGTLIVYKDNQTFISQTGSNYYTRSNREAWNVLYGTRNKPTPKDIGAVALGGDGVIEIGRYIDFHSVVGSSIDFDGRLDFTGSHFNFSKGVTVNGSLCGYGATSLSHDNGTAEPTEGRVHVGGSKYIYFGWCGIYANAGVSAERTYTVPNLTRVHGITISCFTRGGNANFGEVTVKRTYSDGFTFRLYNSSNGGDHFISYIILGD